MANKKESAQPPPATPHKTPRNTTQNPPQHRRWTFL